MKGNSQSRVCQQFFKDTLNVSQKFILKAIEGKVRENKDNRGKHEPKHKLRTEQLDRFKQFIKSIPAVPSHYCRSSSKRLYFPSEIKSVANLYRMYQSSLEKDTSQNHEPISLSCFKKYFKKDFNIGIHVPRKDKCVKCEKYKNLPDELKTEKDNEEYLQHQKEKDEAKLIFLEEQNRSNKDQFLVATFDLQKVLATPHGPCMLYGFSRKYAVYNFTVYESKSQNGYCYLWGEKDGKRGANEICSNLYSYLKQIDGTRLYTKISLFCDNCPGQNKNKFMLHMLAYFLNESKTIMDIHITYLVAGHTYMPVDSMHGVIEKYIQKMNIQAPSE